MLILRVQQLQCTPVIATRSFSRIPQDVNNSQQIPGGPRGAVSAARGQEMFIMRNAHGMSACLRREAQISWSLRIQVASIDKYTCISIFFVTDGLLVQTQNST